MSKAQVTILIPNYKTPELTKLCLRLIRKYTDLNKIHTIVIDNDSRDASLDYLRSLTWIELIERKVPAGQAPVHAHSRALDLALERVQTPYVLSIHTDTLVKRPDWLEFLLAHIKHDKTIAGIGSWKLEEKPFWRQWLKAIEHQVQYLYYQCLGRKEHGLAGIGKNYYYLRSHCALYRTDLLHQHNLHFSDGDLVAGKYIHKALVDAGYQLLFLPSEVLIKYIAHINHATTVLNPELSTREKSVNKGLIRIKKHLERLQADAILQDAGLDS